jgi:hypothetical protein
MGPDLPAVFAAVKPETSRPVSRARVATLGDLFD